MEDFNNDFLNRQADPNDLGAIVQRQGGLLQQVGQGFVRVQSLDEIAAEIGALQFKAVDTSGQLRMIMSAINLLDEFGIDAHFAGFDVNGVAQIYLSADDGSLVAGGGEVALDQNGITIQTSISAPALANSIKWVDTADNVIDQIYSYYAGIVAYGGNEVIAPASGAIEDASNAITAQARDATVAQIILKAFNSASPNSILLNAEIINSNGDIDLASGKTYKINGTNLVVSPTAWTPSWTNLTVGNGTVTARYMQVDKLVVGHLELVFGSTTSISGDVSLSMPVNISSSYGGTLHAIGFTRFLVAGNGYMGICQNGTSANTFRINVSSASGTYVQGAQLSSTVPATWAAGDVLQFEFKYFAA